MRIAVIADIHGNLPALEAVLEDIQHPTSSEQSTWAIVCLALCGHAKSAICLWQVTT